MPVVLNGGKDSLCALRIDERRNVAIPFVTPVKPCVTLFIA
jgi:hypothetical protein